jgi:hypothetical protein
MWNSRWSAGKQDALHRMVRAAPKLESCTRSKVRSDLRQQPIDQDGAVVPSDLWQRRITPKAVVATSIDRRREAQLWWLIVRQPIDPSGHSGSAIVTAGTRGENEQARLADRITRATLGYLHGEA